MPGKKYASIKRPSLYRKLKGKGYSKSKAAAISNAVANGTINYRRGRRKKK